MIADTPIPKEYETAVKHKYATRTFRHGSITLHGYRIKALIFPTLVSRLFRFYHTVLQPQYNQFSILTLSVSTVPSWVGHRWSHRALPNRACMPGACPRTRAPSGRASRSVPRHASARMEDDVWSMIFDIPSLKSVARNSLFTKSHRVIRDCGNRQNRG